MAFWGKEKDIDKDTDFDKVKVTSTGAFYMEGSDIFDDKEKSLELIRKLRAAVKIHNTAHQKYATSDAKK